MTTAVLAEKVTAAELPDRMPQSLAWTVPVRIVQERKAQEFCDSWHLQKCCEVRGHAP